MPYAVPPSPQAGHRRADDAQRRRHAARGPRRGRDGAHPQERPRHGGRRCRTPCRRLPRLGIVVLTMHNDDDTLLEALDAGATALILKSAPATEVVDAVRRAAVSPDAFTATGLAAALRRQQATTVPRLTPRETEVLARLVDGASVAEVSRDLYMSESTVKTHVA